VHHGTAPSGAVGGEHHFAGHETIELAAAAVVATDDEAWREALDLPRPVAEQRGRADDEHRAVLALGLGLMEVERDDLEGLAQAHVVGQAPTEAEGAQLPQPCEPSPLVGPEGGLQAGWLR